LQNKANVKMGKMNLSLTIIKDYEDLGLIYGSNKSQKQTQTKPIQSQNKPNCQKVKNERKKCYNNEL